jgi:DNA processing protein
VRKIGAIVINEPSTVDAFEAFLESAADLNFIRTKYSRSEVMRVFADVAEIEGQLERINASYITFKNRDFPTYLIAIANPPAVIFYKGDAALLDADKNTGIIGTCNPSDDALKVGDRVVEVFVSVGYAIVSGLALGCDTIAHRGALNQNGTTVAVQPSRFLSIYPASNRTLTTEIVERGGLWVSEYFPAAKPPKNTLV